MKKQRENQIEQDELFRFWFAGLKGIGNREKIQLTKEFPQKNTLYYNRRNSTEEEVKREVDRGKGGDDHTDHTRRKTAMEQRNCCRMAEKRDCACHI